MIVKDQTRIEWSNQNKLFDIQKVAFNIQSERITIYREESIYNLQLELCPSPMSPLGIVSKNNYQQKSNLIQKKKKMINISGSVTYRIVLSVRMRIHWGIGRFCFCFLAKIFFILKVLWEPFVRGEEKKYEF